jgi:phosphatidylglycerophosphatase A
MRKFIITLFGSFFYTGFFSFAPATFASFVWLLCYLFIPGGQVLAHPILLIVLIPIAIYLSWEMEGYHGKDAHVIVIDEVVGMQVTFLGVEPTLIAGILGFLLFRIFDIVKPFPVGRSQGLKGGFGVVTDDLLAGAYARLVLFILAGVLHVI